MNKIKINVDRPKISSKEIQSKMNFEQILANQQLMATPFYKNPWFFGTTGLATVSIIASAIYSFNNPPPTDTKHQIVNEVMTSSVPTPQSKQPLAVITKKEEIEETNNHLKPLPIDQTSTLNKDKTTNQKPRIESTSNQPKELTVVEDEIDENQIDVNENLDQTFDFFDFHPRISGKVNGEISKQDLFDINGIVTNTDVKVVHFELHLIDGTGGKVFVEDGNQLTTEMKKAIEHVGTGEDIYFEDINGLTTNGKKVKLSPLKYTILN